MIPEPHYPVEPWCVRETAARPRPAGPVRVGLRPLQRPHRTARPTSTRATRTACPARTSTRSTSCARCPTPRPATATRSPARRSSTSPTASRSGCWSTTSRSTSGTANCAPTSGVLDLRAGTLEPHRRVVLAGRQGRSGCARIRLVSFTQRSIAAICYEVEPVDEPARLILQSELVANEDVPIQTRRPPGGRRPGRAAGGRGAHRTATPTPCSSTTPGAASCASPPAWTTS